jgi:acetolactate synthase-1/2/3 large subunit
MTLVKLIGKPLIDGARWSGPSRVVVSGLGDDTGGGLYVLEDSTFSVLDGVSSTGLAVSADGSRLARLLWAEDEVDFAGELLIYDSRGLLAHHRLDELRQPHGVVWDGHTLVVVSTGTNAILWVDPSGVVRRTWKAPGNGDSWHLNSLAWRRGRMLISAFGRFAEHHEWVQESAREGAGIVFDVCSGRDVLGGLSAPHNPLWLDGGWLVCNSGAGELLRVDRKGRVRARRAFSGWTRGLAFDEALVYLGVSAHRLRGADRGTACVVGLTRDGLEEVDRWDVPSREVYDVIVAPRTLLDGVRRGVNRWKAPAGSHE